MWSPRRATAAGAIAAGLVALASAASAVAADESYLVDFTPAGQAAARAAIIKSTDLGASGWTSGGVDIPDPRKDQGCKTFHPKRADLVLNGSAGVVYMASGGVLRIDSRADVLKTPRMLRLDWQRALQAPGLAACLRKNVAGNVRAASVTRLKLPRIGTFTTGYRVVAEAKGATGKFRFLVDLVYVGKGRTEITLITTSPTAAAATIVQAEIRIARTLATRVRA